MAQNEVDKKSRYAGTPLTVYEHPSGEQYELRELREIPRPRVVFSYSPRDGERIDQLSARFYRDPLLFWRIADASDQLDPFNLVMAGEPLPVPPNK